ncbi:MAG: SDR family oxidoreductase [Methylobacteriaceae bacterium]|nr:SDR family oxidoreductase [Methylobacteriaceae bacterium]
MAEQQRVAVVTGGASGIGEATARRFAESGANVIIGDVDSTRGEGLAAELEHKGQKATYYHVDLASDEAVATFADAVAAEHGAPNVLVNSGGLLQNAVHLLEMDMAEFDRLWQVNVRGTLLASRAFGRAMCAARHGSIVNLCSLTSFRASAQVGYAVGKAGLKMLTEIMAADFGPKGVRVNAVAPGYTLTPAMQARIEKGERDPDVVIRGSALRRFVAPSEVADAIFFLCSPQAAAITGVTMPIDCGWLAMTAYNAYASQP